MQTATKNPPPDKLESTELGTVTGGAAALSPVPDMGPPKYSGPWWDWVRAKGSPPTR